MLAAIPLAFINADMSKTSDNTNYFIINVGLTECPKLSTQDGLVFNKSQERMCSVRPRTLTGYKNTYRLIVPSDLFM